MRVLLATDGSKYAESAAWFLSRLPHKEKLHLTILSVHPQRDVHGSVEVMNWMKKHEAEEISRSKAACQRILTMFDGANATAEVVTCAGHPGKEIVRQAELLGVDLVVVGAEGRSVVDRIVMGSVSDFVATHAHCSVLVSRPTGLQKGEHKELGVCVAFDGSAPSRHAMEELRQFDWHHNTRFEVVNVMEFPTMHMDIPIEIDVEPIRDAIEATTEDAAKSLAALSSNVDWRVIESGHVGESIVRYAEDQDCDLVVVGNTGLGLVGQFLLGGVSRYIASHSKCSVWIARNSNATQQA